MPESITQLSPLHKYYCIYVSIITDKCSTFYPPGDSLAFPTTDHNFSMFSLNYEKSVFIRGGDIANFKHPPQDVFGAFPYFVYP